MRRSVNKIFIILSVMALVLSGCGKEREDPGVFEEYTGYFKTDKTTEKTTEITTEKNKEDATEDTRNDSIEDISEEPMEGETEENLEELTEAGAEESKEKLSDDMSDESPENEAEETTESQKLADNTAAGPEADASDFVLLTEAVPDAILEIRYYSTYNFVGERIDGYEEPVALITKEAGAALKEVSDDLVQKGYRLKIFDAYRPQMAVDNFVDWAEDVSDTKMKEYFYPELDKSVLFNQGYIAKHSGHSRGSTVDLTLFDMETEKEVDMGGTFDYFGQLSHPDYTGITDEQYANRKILRDAMTAHGFKPITSEWWHFTLVNEPYPNTYFTFPVNSQSVGK